MHKILIIGGMGPQASLLLHKRIIQYASDQGAVQNEDYPLIYHLSIPVPDFIHSSATKHKALGQIKHALDCLWLTPGHQGSYSL